MRAPRSADEIQLVTPTAAAIFAKFARLIFFLVFSITRVLITGQGSCSWYKNSAT